MQTLYLKEINIDFLHYNIYYVYRRYYFHSCYSAIRCNRCFHRYIFRIRQDRKTAIYPDNWGIRFSVGEKQAILVFKERVLSEEFYHPNGKIIDNKIIELLRDIDCGLWDSCLYWDYVNYRNAVATNEVAERMIRNSQPVMMNQQS